MVTNSDSYRHIHNSELLLNIIHWIRIIEFNIFKSTNSWQNLDVFFDLYLQAMITEGLVI